MQRNWHAIEGPNGMCACGVKADGTVVTCGALLEAEVAQRLQALEAALKSLTDDMDRAGGDGYGMPECPWCGAQEMRDGDDKWHEADCELAKARAALLTSPPAPSRGGNPEGDPELGGKQRPDGGSHPA